MKFRFIQANRSTFRVVKMAIVLGVSESGYYAWAKRQSRGPNPRTVERETLRDRIFEIYTESNCVYGSRKITRILRRKYKMNVNHKRIENIMHDAGIRSKASKKYKATTNSKHNLPVSENLLNRDFRAFGPNQKMVSDITYIRTDEGWLYLASIMDLYGRKIVGMAMDSTMTKELVIRALVDAKSRIGKVKDCILHSDRGTQYCSRSYQNLLRASGFISSMSRKGNCWDNAPMESFWGKLKQEWLNEQHFKTRDEAKKAVFEYIWIFYNRKRAHAANDYMTPEEYYSQAA